VAVTVTEVCVLTPLVDAVKLVLACPPGTVTLVGTETAAFELVRLTAVPPDGAAAVRVTAPVEEAPRSRSSVRVPARRELAWCWWPPAG
jgi:hypothetical protein